MNHYLSLVLFTPLAGVVLLLFVNKQNENAIRWIANLVALAGFLISRGSEKLLFPKLADQ